MPSKFYNPDYRLLKKDALSLTGKGVIIQINPGNKQENRLTIKQTLSGMQGPCAAPMLNL